MSATPSLSGSPVRDQSLEKMKVHTSADVRNQILSDFDSVAPAHLYQHSYSHIGAEDIKFPYQLPMTPSDFGSAEESAYCSPQPALAELSYPPVPSPITATSVPAARTSGQEQRTHATSGRRRAQNRAAQRAFRERKEKHARDLETALTALTEKYRSLEISHLELNAAYEKLRKTIELLTTDDDGAEDIKGQSRETLRKLLAIIHGEVAAKKE